VNRLPNDIALFTVFWLVVAFTVLATAASPNAPILVLIYFFEVLKILWEGFDKAAFIEKYSSQ